MTRPPLGFQRIVLGLHAGAPSRATAFAAQFAALFDLELLGLFLDDVGLRHLSGFPFAREISSLGGRWRPIEPARALSDIDLAAGGAERRFIDAARGLARRRFEIARGGAAQALAAMLRAGDIVTLGAPGAPAERAADPFASLLETAFASRAAVMLTPAREARSTGPIVAVAARADDPSIEAAREIAAATREELVVVDMRAEAAQDWLAARRAAAPSAPSAEALPQALRRLSERLTVASRESLTASLAAALAAARGVPVLSIDGRER